MIHPDLEEKSSGKKRNLSVGFNGNQDDEKKYSSRVDLMHRAYEQRIENLKESISRAVHSVLEDDLLATMKEETTSRAFIIERVKEIFVETINTDKDDLIDSMSQEVSYAKAELYKLQEDKSKLLKQICKISKDAAVKEHELENKIKYEAKEVERLQDQINDVQRQYTELKQEIINMQKINERQLASKDEEYSSDKMKIEAKLTDAVSESAEYRKQLKEIETDMEETLSKVIDMDKKNKEFEKKTAALDEECSKLEQSLEEKNKAVEELERFIEFLKESNSRMEEENNAMKNMLEDVEQQFHQRERAIEQVLEEQHKNFENERALWEEERSSIAKKLKGEKRESKGLIRDLQNRLQEQERQTMSWKLAFEEENVRASVERENEAKTLREKDLNYKKSLEEIENLYNNQLAELQNQINYEKDHKRELENVLSSQLNEIQERAYAKFKQLDEKEAQAKNYLEERAFQMKEHERKEETLRKEKEIDDRNRQIERLKTEVQDRDNLINELKNVVIPQQVEELDALDDKIRKEQEKFIECKNENNELKKRLEEMGHGLLISERELNNTVDLREREIEELQIAFHEQAEENLRLSNKLRDLEAHIETINEESNILPIMIEKYKSKVEALQEELKFSRSQSEEYNQKFLKVNMELEDLHEKYEEKEASIARLKSEFANLMEDTERRRREIVQTKMNLQRHYSIAKKSLLTEAKRLKQETRELASFVSAAINLNRQSIHQQAKHFFLLMTTTIEKKLTIERETMLKSLTNKKIELKEQYKSKNDRLNIQIEEARAEYMTEVNRVKEEGLGYKEAFEKLRNQINLLAEENDVIKRENQRFLELFEKAQEEITYLTAENTRLSEDNKNILEETIRLKDSCQNYISEVEERSNQEVQHIQKESKKAFTLQYEKEEILMGELVNLREEVEALRVNYQEKYEVLLNDIQRMKGTSLEEQDAKHNNFLEMRSNSNLLKTYEDNLNTLQEEITALNYSTELEKEKILRTLALKEQNILKLDFIIKEIRQELQKKGQELSEAKMEISRLESVTKDLNFEIELLKKNVVKRNLRFEDSDYEAFLNQCADNNKLRLREEKEDKAELRSGRAQGPEKKNFKMQASSGLLEKLKNLKNLQISLDQPTGRSTGSLSGEGYSPLHSNRSNKKYF